jgi:hypothetical protein
MSRGPGHVERAITGVFTERPTQTFTVSELAAFVYPTVAVPAKRHTVALLRAADRVAKRMWWRSLREWRLHGHYIFYNRLDLHSCAMGNLRARENWHQESVAELDARLAPGGKHSEKMVPNGAWWNEVEQAKAEAAGDTERVRHFQALDAKWLVDFCSGESFDATLFRVQLDGAIEQGRKDVAGMLAGDNPSGTLAA